MSSEVRANSRSERGLILACILLIAFAPPASAEDPCRVVWSPTFGGHHDLAGVANDAVVIDGPRGREIVVGGIFNAAGSIAVNNVASWDGRSWHDLFGGVRTIDGTTAAVRSLLAMSPQASGQGSGTLIVAGAFQKAGDVAVGNLASWDGFAWTSLGGGVNGPVAALASWTRDGVDVVVAGGAFDHAGSVSASHIAQWDGRSWQPLGNGTEGEVKVLGVSPPSDGNELFAAGDLSSHVVRWNGSAWVAASQGLPPSPDVSVRAFARANLGDGDSLYAAIDSDSGLLYRWQGGNWISVGGDGASHPIGFATSLDQATVDGTPVLAISGDAFDAPDGWTSVAVAWDGRRWTPFHPDEGLGSCAGFVQATLGDAKAEELYALAWGTIEHPFGSIARYDGATWRALSSGNGGVVESLLEWTTPGGEKLLIAGGALNVLGGNGLRSIAAWNGRDWLSLGATSGSVRALAVYDDGAGDGEKLYAGGEFGIEGLRNEQSLAAWNGDQWTDVPGIEGLVDALATFDDGSGPALYVGGSFYHISDASIDGFGRWNGAWSSVDAPPFGHVSALCVWDDGGGLALYVGATSGVWRWDGETWSTVGAAASGGTGAPIYIECMIGTSFGLFVSSYLDSWSPVATVSRWDGRVWETSVGGFHQLATSLARFDDGSGHGEQLYAGIGEAVDDGESLRRWDGIEWSPVAGAPAGPIYALLPRGLADGGKSLLLGGAFVGGAHGEAILAQMDACAEGCLGDIDGDGAVGPSDLSELLGSWDERGSAGDVDRDGVVTGLDLAIVLGAWGPCG